MVKIYDVTLVFGNNKIKTKSDKIPELNWNFKVEKNNIFYILKIDSIETNNPLKEITVNCNVLKRFLKK